MHCPICIVPLNVAECQGVEIAFCPKCRGVWLDRGELDKIIERSTLETPFRPFRSSGIMTAAISSPMTNITMVIRATTIKKSVVSSMICLIER